MNADYAWHRKEAFQEVMRREAVRSSMSGRSFLLLLFDVSVGGLTEMTGKIISVLFSSTREIDRKGRGTREVPDETAGPEKTALWRK